MAARAVELHPYRIAIIEARAKLCVSPSDHHESRPICDGACRHRRQESQRRAQRLNGGSPTCISLDHRRRQFGRVLDRRPQPRPRSSEVDRPRQHLLEPPEPPFHRPIWRRWCWCWCWASRPCPRRGRDQARLEHRDPQVDAAPKKHHGRWCRPPPTPFPSAAKADPPIQPLAPGRQIAAPRLARVVRSIEPPRAVGAPGHLHPRCHSGVLFLQLLEELVVNDARVPQGTSPLVASTAPEASPLGSLLQVSRGGFFHSPHLSRPETPVFPSGFVHRLSSGSTRSGWCAR